MSRTLVQDIGLGIKVHLYEDATWAVYLNDRRVEFGAEAIMSRAMEFSNRAAEILFKQEWDVAERLGQLRRIATIEIDEMLGAGEDE
jgi:hypothetical protein